MFFYFTESHDRPFIPFLIRNCITFVFFCVTNVSIHWGWDGTKYVLFCFLHFWFHSEMTSQITRFHRWSYHLTHGTDKSTNFYTLKCTNTHTNKNNWHSFEEKPVTLLCFNSSGHLCETGGSHIKKTFSSTYSPSFLPPPSLSLSLSLFKYKLTHVHTSALIERPKCRSKHAKDQFNLKL